MGYHPGSNSDFEYKLKIILVNRLWSSQWKCNSSKKGGGGIYSHLLGAMPRRVEIRQWNWYSSLYKACGIGFKTWYNSSGTTVSLCEKNSEMGSYKGFKIERSNMKISTLNSVD